MLKLSEFTVGTLATAKPHSLVIGRYRSESTFLVGGTDENPMAFKLDGQPRFQCWSSKGAYNWGGVIVPNVLIEVDPESLVDTNSGSAPAGALSRRGTSLLMYVQDQPGFIRVAPIFDAVLDPVGEEQTAAFARWQIVLGEGLDKRVLCSVDVMPKAQA